VYQSNPGPTVRPREQVINVSSFTSFSLVVGGMRCSPSPGFKSPFLRAETVLLGTRLASPYTFLAVPPASSPLSTPALRKLDMSSSLNTFLFSALTFLECPESHLHIYKLNVYPPFYLPLRSDSPPFFLNTFSSLCDFTSQEVFILQWKPTLCICYPIVCIYFFLPGCTAQ